MKTRITETHMAIIDWKREDPVYIDSMQLMVAD